MTNCLVRVFPVNSRLPSRNCRACGGELTAGGASGELMSACAVALTLHAAAKYGYEGQWWPGQYLLGRAQAGRVE